MTLSENVQRLGYPQLREAAGLSWYKLFKKTKESIVRRWVDVSNGRIDFPPSIENLLGVYIVDRCGDTVPLFEDNKKSIDDRPAARCTCNTCDEQDCMCPLVQDATVLVDVVIDGDSYSNKTTSRILKNGQLVEEIEAWVPAYDAGGDLIDVQVVRSQRTICQLDTLSCGCVASTDANCDALYTCGCVIDCYVPYLRHRYPEIYSEYGYYKTDDTKKKIYLFDRNGKKSRLKQVKLVYESNGADMLVPDYARSALIALLDLTRKMYSPSFTYQDEVAAKRRYAREKNEMIKDLNPIPFEWFVQVGDAVRKHSHPVHAGDHGGTWAGAQYAPPTQPICALPGGAGGAGGGTGGDNITNITNTTLIGPDYLKVVVDGGQPDSPQSGINTYTNLDLIGVGKNSKDKVEFELDKIQMYNWTTPPDFSMNKTTGTITLNNGLTFQPLSTLKMDKNQ